MHARLSVRHRIPRNRLGGKQLNCFSTAPARCGALCKGETALSRGRQVAIRAVGDVTGMDEFNTQVHAAADRSSRHTAVHTGRAA